MAFIDVFKVEAEHRAIHGVPTKGNKSAKMLILEYIIVKVPDNTKEKSKLIQLYGKYNIGDSVVEYNSDPTLGPPVPSASPFTYLKLDGSNTMDDGYIPISPKSVITLDYFQSQGTGLTLGETDITAYRGDRGTIGYNHALTTHAPSNAEPNRVISDLLTLDNSATSASSAAVYALENAKSETTHNHDAAYEPINLNIQTHIADGSIHFSVLDSLSDVSTYVGNQGKLLKVNATEDGTIWGDPAGTSVAWGDITGTLATQTDIQAALDGKIDDSQVLTDVPVSALFTDTVYDSTAVDSHIATVTGNPHAVSSTDVGLGSVDNTTDLAKPISTATQTALDLKQNNLLTDWIISTAYTTENTKSAQLGIVQTGGSVTLDSTNDGGISTGHQGQILNDRGSDLTISIAAGDTVLGSNVALSDGYFAYFIYLGAQTWAIAVGSAGGSGDNTNLGYTSSPTNGIVTSDTGTDATLTLATETNAGLLAPADFTTLDQLNNTPIITQGNITYTFLLTDINKYIRNTSGVATTNTVPLNSSVAYSIGTKIHITQGGSGGVTIVATGGVTINTAETLVLRKQNSLATLIKVGTDEWDLTGDLTQI